MGSIDFEKIEFLSNKYGWAEGFLTYTAALHTVCTILFPERNWESFFARDKYCCHKKIALSQLRMPYIFNFTEMIRIFRERGQKMGKQDYFMLTYYLYARIRYYLTSGGRVPIHDHWFKF